MKSWVVFLGLLVTVASSEKISYKGYSVLRALPQSNDELNFFKNLNATDGGEVIN